MDFGNLIILIIIGIAIYIIKKRKFDDFNQNKSKQPTENISIKSDDELLEVLKKKCDSKCLICYSLVELFKDVVNKNRN